MTILEAIKTSYSRRQDRIPPRSTSVELLTDVDTIELLLLQVAVDYKRPRGPLRGRTKKEQMKRLGFTYIQEGEDSFVVTTRNKAFLMKKNEQYYHFNKADLAVRLMFCGDSVEIENRAFILNTPYEHPTVHADGDICVDINWGEREDIYFGHPYLLDFNIDSLAEKISKVLTVGKRTLQKGYVTDVNPVTDISDYKHIDAASLKEARQYALSHNVDMTRIFDNDPQIRTKLN